MQEYDSVELLSEKENYAKYGVHKGMQGWICDPRTIDGTWLVNFPQCGEHADIAEIPVAEGDLKTIEGLSSVLNEHIREQWGESDPAEVNPVEVTVEKSEYAQKGVHKGMQGKTFYEDPHDGSCLAVFLYSDRPESFADVSLAAGDFKRIPRVEPGVNEQIMEEYS